MLNNRINDHIPSEDWEISENVDSYDVFLLYKNNPNDQQLGEKIREYFNEIKQRLGYDKNKNR